jgi:uncharacterized protein (TIGR00369 family)
MAPLADPHGPPRPAWVEAFLASPQFRDAGLEIRGLGPGEAVLALPARPAWRGDPVRNRTHTGCLSVLADTACGLSVGTRLDPPAPFVTLDLRMDYLRSADAGRGLVCVARCHRLAGEVAFVRGELRQEGGDDLVAYASATFMLAGRRAAPAGTRPARSGRTPEGRTPLQAEAMAGTVQPALPRGRSPYVDYLGILRQAGPGAGPVYRLPFREQLVGNPAVPALHGGVLAGFGETAMILHLAAGAAPGALPKGVDFTMEYLRPALARDTFAQATTLRLGSRVALVQAVVWQEDPDRPIALARGHCLMGRR